MSKPGELSPADQAAEQAWTSLEANLVNGTSFVFEAGAGAGKTYSLIQALRYLLGRSARELIRRHQQIACITYTNVARDMIVAKTDGHPAIYCETTHVFAWRLISAFQKQLRELVPRLPGWQQRAGEFAETEIQQVEYALGRRHIDGSKVSIHHDDVFPLFIELLKSAKFRGVVSSLFPIILIDEYQDTNAALVNAFKEHFLGKDHAPQFGFFGDHWQKIYGDGCGSIKHHALHLIDKGANFRSAKPIVDCLNRIRPKLPQAVRDPDEPGDVVVFHTNEWAGNRQTRNHWQGDLPSDASAKAFAFAKDQLSGRGWQVEPGITKILMLTHRALATEMGYASLPSVFRHNDSFTRKANDVIAFFNDHLEPAAEAFLSRRFGKMFEAIDARRPLLKGPADKAKWASVMQRVCELRKQGTVGDMIAHLLESHLPILSEAVIQMERSLADAKVFGEELSSRLAELERLHAVPYREIVELCRYLHGSSPFETKHGVKGDQFENVLVVFGRGWNDYDFDAYLTMARSPVLQAQQAEAYERYRNLFYVAVSRPKKRLALLFTQKLSTASLATLNDFFNGNDIVDIGANLR